MCKAVSVDQKTAAAIEYATNKMDKDTKNCGECERKAQNAKPVCPKYLIARI
jgi:hypothetical protein